MRSFAGSRKEMLFGQLLTSIDQKFRRDDGKACASLGARAGKTPVILDTLIHFLVQALVL
jgi:hypothetical protein